MAGFLLFRYFVVAAAVVGVGCALRARAAWPGLAVVPALGVATWLFAWAPLEQPYGLRPGTDVSFDYGLVSSSAARGDVSSSWVVGRASPRPLWGLLWRALAPGNPLRARTLLALFPVVLLSAMPLAVYWFARSVGLDAWVSAATAFTAVLAASTPLDAESPFLLFHRGVFFASPARGLALVVAVVVLGLSWSPPSGATTGRRRLAAGISLAALVWLDVAVALWATLTVAMAAVLAARFGKATERMRPVLLLGIGSLALRAWFHAAMEPLARVPAADEVLAIRTVFRDIGFVTLDMRWVFVLAALGAYRLWRRARPSDLRILSMLAAAYVAWVAGGLGFHLRPFADADALFHLVRFSAAFVAGIGAHDAFEWLWRYARDRGGAILGRWVERAGSSGLAFACAVLVLLPESAAFSWRPAMFDPLYYPSTYEWDPSVRRLERWLLQQTQPDAIVLTGDATSEWVASLTGRRVLGAERVLDRDVARERRRAVRRLLLSGEPESMRAALDTLDADVLVLDPALREVYWELDERLLESAGLFKKAHQIGDRYAVYVAE